MTMSASQQKKLRQEQETTAAAARFEKAQQAKKEARKIKLMTTGFFAVIALVLITVIVGGFFSSGYLERHTTALTVNDHKISPAEMQYFYMDTINQFTENYKDLLPYLINSKEPLDQQKYSEDKTWADFFLESAVSQAKEIYALYDEAVANGHTLSEAGQAALNSKLLNTEIAAKLNGFSSVTALLKANCGKGCDEKSYTEYLRVWQVATDYAGVYYNGLTFTDAELRAAEAENMDKYSSFSFRAYYASTQGFLTSEDPTDEQTAAARAEAKAAAQAIVNAAVSEEGFIQAVRENCALGDKETYREESATLYPYLLKENVNTVLQDWVCDSSRKTGDVTLIAQGDAGSESGFFAVYYVGSRTNSDVKMVNVRHILVSTSDSVTAEQAKEKILTIKDEYDQDPTEENFIKLASANSDDGSKSNGGLLEHIYQGATVEPFDSWIFANRKPGDVGIVESQYGCHLVYFVSADEMNYRDYLIHNQLTSDGYTAWHDALVEKATTAEGSGMKRVNCSIVVNTSTNS